MAEAIIVILIIFAIIGYVSKYKSNSKKSSPTKRRTSAKPEPSPKPSVNSEIMWLKDEWKKLFDARKADTDLSKNTPTWYFDEVTERQLKKLESLEISVSGGQLTKGQASDLIGLFSPIGEEDQEILKFFKIGHKDMSETRGRHAVRNLMAESERREQWETRPATPVQKEFYKFFGIKAPTGLTARDAAKALRETLAADHDEDMEEKVERWSNYEDIIKELLGSKEDLREQFELKRPSLALIREAVEELVKEGEELVDLDAYSVAEKIKELKPEMEVEAA